MMKKGISLLAAACMICLSNVSFADIHLRDLMPPSGKTLYTLTITTPGNKPVVLDEVRTYLGLSCLVMLEAVDFLHLQITKPSRILDLLD